MRLPRLLCALLAALSLAAGCARLLPKAQSEVHSPWGNFEEARTAFERIEPDRTTASDLRVQGIDPYTSENVKILSYSDILLKFPIANGWSRDTLDAGLRRCLEAGKECIGYSIDVHDVKRDHVGGFWSDTLGFKRIVDVSGWTFNGLILLVDNRVVYTLYGGQPKVREKEVSRQPLGPVQNLGEAVGGFVRP
ncbi:MAG TPA: hypothetical protein VFP36_10480 [Usitatibacter sp.]|nr:hypothetical protein [Usitatibacter sp.]